jgi:hypothetical protein
LRREEAAQALGLSEESFDRYVRDHVDCVRLGTLRIWPVSELERFLAERGAGAPPQVSLTRAAVRARSRSGFAASGERPAKASQRGGTALMSPRTQTKSRFSTPPVPHTLCLGTSNRGGTALTARPMAPKE